MNMLRIVVTGKEGHVARSMLAIGAASEVEIVAVGRPELDLSDPTSVLSALDAAVSAAACTAVDRAKSEQELAFAVNGVGAGAVGKAADKLGVPLLHLSSDNVFDGTKTERCFESDRTDPTSAYGTSKLEDERQVAGAIPNHAIFRTAWMYSPYGANFLKIMLRLGETRESLSVMAD